MQSHPSAASHASGIPSRLLIISDTHGRSFDEDEHWVLPSEEADVVLHCGDLTQESRLEEFRATIELLKRIKAKRRIAIAGNHELTLDPGVFSKHLAQAGLSEDDAEVQRIYGRKGQARQLLESVDPDIQLLDEGTHRIPLDNGALLSLYISPFTPRKADEAMSSTDAEWAFQYEGHNVAGPEPAHRFDIRPDTAVVMTHGPPRGILDYTDSKRAGCPDLFAAVARAQPLLHCFGHVHSSWGAKMIAWRQQVSDLPSHFTDVDNDESEVLESLKSLVPGRHDDVDERRKKRQLYEEIAAKGYVALKPERTDGTLFVNAAMEGSEECPVQPPFMVEIMLPARPS